jgi:GNAT superfamily N-acetyltransferase
MDPVVLRPLRPSDLPAVSALFDTALGSGFWSLDAGSYEYCRLAAIDGVLIGAAAAALIDRLDEAPSLRGPVGLIRLVAVHETARRKGVATRLVESLSRFCLDAGASSLASFAWVRGDSGICPLSGALTSLGFERLRRLDSFYADESETPCPACHRAPCVCSADLYVRDGDRLRR